MKRNIEFDKVADIYDYYVRVDFDIPFFIKETENSDDEILELMCGTGRVSIPLLKAGRKMTCVDYSQNMLQVFREKIRNENYKVSLIHQDIIQLNLNRKFKMAFLPFHSLSEILSYEKQQKAIQSIAAHLEKGGIFILTLQNPGRRLQSADGTTRLVGKFHVDDEKNLIISSSIQHNPVDGIVSGFQFYEIYDSKNALIEKRFLEINFRLVSDLELRTMIQDTGLKIMEVYGDYAYGSFNEQSSDFMIYKMIKQ